MSAQLQTEMHVIRQSGLLLSSWYVAQRPALAARDEDGVAHFCTQGWREGAKPNPYFDPAWYLAQNPEIAAAGVNPLLHYIAFGEAEGRDPSPWFDTAWYREAYGLGPREPCLKHYLERRTTGQINPVPVFDAAYYLDNNPDVAKGGADPFEHFCAFGAQEGRNPSADFDTKYYVSRHGAALQGQNPLLHYLAQRERQPGLTTRPDAERHVAACVRNATRPAAFFEEFQPAPAHLVRLVQMLAYYLPQFHSVPENDAWWGKGFTDWTNLGRACPRFVGHVQPRIPRDLGHYSLDDPQTLKRQVAMAKAAGLSGFVFYTYWFNRHRLLEKPLNQFLADKTLDFGFCALWANENWTRRWDGLEREVLIAQEYLEADDPALINNFAQLFEDTRYIRIEGRPLMMIYRPGLIPDARVRIAKWRRMFAELHGENPLLIMAQSLGEDYDPTPYGLDGAVEFPPHKLSQDTAAINDTLELLDPDFCATVHDYADIAATSLAQPVPDYPLIKTIVPGWDNDPRREGKGLVLQGATPALYQDWLERLVAYTARHDFYGARIICVNAWNEWAEGAYLEPDVHAGAAYLNATARAVCAPDAAGFASGLLLVGHDAQQHGAQLLLLHIARRLRRLWGIRLHMMLLGAGPLLNAYREVADVTVLQDRTEIGNLAAKFRASGVRSAIVNSAAAARVVPWLESRGIATTMLVHELPQLLREYNLEIQARLGAVAASHIVFSSDYLRGRFLEAVGQPQANATVLAQGNYQAMQRDETARARVRRSLGVGDEQFLVLAAGFAHLRKGFDLFLQLARKFAALRQDVHFIWVGDIEFSLKTYLGPDMARGREAGYFTHIPFTAHVADYFSAADVYALTSREDPLPTVVMEALACGMPCVAFEESGGIPELLRREKAGRVARAGDVDEFLAEMTALLDHEKLAAMRPRLALAAARNFDFGSYVDRLLHLVEPGLRRVSVAVLNYNYAQYLPQRLQSIFAQTYPVAEILFLDDASTDDSLEVARRVAQEAGRELKFIANATNQGVFAQWRRAAQNACGEFIWLCEADDAASPAFLSRLLAACASAEAPLMAFSDSRAVDADGQQVMADYKSYYFDAGAKGLMRSGIWQGRDFAASFLSLRNLIPNVSAVLWRRDALLTALDAVQDLARWQLAGDWRLYLALLTGQPGELVYVAEPLNTHRRHQAGVTQALSPQAHVEEIRRMQALAAECLALAPAMRAAQAADLGRVAAQLGAELSPVAKKKGSAPVARRRKV